MPNSRMWRHCFSTTGYNDVAGGVFTANTVEVSGGGDTDEGEAMTFTFTRTGDLSRAADVYYTVGGSAGAADFASAFGDHVSFAAGEASVTLTLNTLNDGVYEGDESFSLELAPDAAHFDLGASSSASATIIDAQTPPPALHIANAVATEGGTLVFRVSLDAPVGYDITFDARTDTGTHAVSGTDPTLVNFGTATPGNQPNGDYNGFPATQYTIHAGDTYVDIPVTTRTDALIEGNETMSLRLSNASGATIVPGVGTGRGIGTIVDGTPQITRVSYYADADNVTEGGDLRFYFHRDVATAALDVRYWMNTFPGGGAIPGVDFTIDNTNLTFVAGDGSSDFMLGQDHWSDPTMFVHFDPGQTDVVLTLHTIDDGLAEPFGEAFALHFDFGANGANVQIDGAASEAAYLAAFPAANPTQVNIGHIVDPIV